MRIVDTNIVSTFARVGSLELLTELPGDDTLYITAATYHELRKAVKVGCHFLLPVVDAVNIGTPVDLIELTRNEILATRSLPDSLGPGEAESIAVCLRRPSVQFLTNDKRAKNVCREHGVGCLDLPAILRALWTKQVISREEVQELVTRIESEQGMVIRNKDEILKTASKSNRPRRRRN